MAMILMFPLVASSDETKSLQLEEVKIEYNKYVFSRDPLFYSIPKKEHIALGFSTTLFGVGFWNANLHGESDASQFHSGGLQIDLGVHLSNWIDLGLRHDSKHILDDSYPYQKYPAEDSIQINIYLFRRENKKSIYDLF